MADEGAPLLARPPVQRTTSDQLRELAQRVRFDHAALSLLLLLVVYLAVRASF